MKKKGKKKPDHKLLAAYGWGFVSALLLVGLLSQLSSGSVQAGLQKGLDQLDGAVETLDRWLYGDELAEPTEPTVAQGELLVDVIDVGQGQSILLCTQEKAVLIDAGENGQGAVVCQWLAQRGVTELDLAIGTHGHSDHIGGMDEVMSSLPVAEFWMGAMPEKLVPSTKTYLSVLEQLDIGRIPYREPEAGTTYDLGCGGELTVLGPLGEPEDLNNCSLVCRVDFGDVSFLFCGDAEEPEEALILRSGADVDADVLVLGHHGSSSSTSNTFLKAVSLQLAAISCGKDNDYGHPHSSTIRKLKNGGITYRRTDLNGSISFLTNGKTVSYSTEK